MTTARRLAAVAVAPALVLAAATVAFALPPYTTAPKTSASITALLTPTSAKACGNSSAAAKPSACQ